MLGALEAGGSFDERRDIRTRQRGNAHQEACDAGRLPKREAFAVRLASS
jgi:hypothetical protein